ncbi:MAG: tRNA uridine-5-carboxymethylaminomethyl(34) synthesis GTPase MnmE [Bacteroidetes bacterium]|nr:tRNA uridine-5-carboxymethylaminomethyl(34) synthesis GTPase MnmE [Bacteroidota bacterium]
MAVIRVSGSDSFAVCDKIFRAKHGKKLQTQPQYSVIYGNIVDTDGGDIIDDVLISVFRAPHSFTAEDTVEISCHGSLYIQQKIMQLLINNGCRAAQPGEFTMRAFVNGKIDLSQAEAVADLIASTSKAMHKMAITQMRGGFSVELQKLRGQLLDFVSLIELELDFSEEDVEFADRRKLRDLAVNIEQHIGRLADSFSVGNVLKNGVPVALVGKTNVGKSTLLNVLLNEEKAIVSDIHGTTRDTIEDSVAIDGIVFRFIDTAGIRDTEDEVENLGIRRTFQKIDAATIVLWLVDATEISDIMTDIVPEDIDRSKTVLVVNKSDMVSADRQKRIGDIVDTTGLKAIFISAKRRTNIDLLQKLLVDTVQLNKIDTNAVIVNNVRHYEALVNARRAIVRVVEGLDTQISGDLLSQDIRECMHYLGEITGQISTDEILGNIFSKFCIGK